jgi:hypothetical protein
MDLTVLSEVLKMLFLCTHTVSTPFKYVRVLPNELTKCLLMFSFHSFPYEDSLHDAKVGVW